MKRLIHIPILILIVGIAACSPVEQIQEEHSLGETLRLPRGDQGATLGKSTTTVDPNADAKAKTDAEELSPAEDAALSLPEISPTVTDSAQNSIPEGEQESASEQHVEPVLATYFIHGDS